MGKDLGAPTTGAGRLKFRAWDPFNKRMYKAPFITFEPDGSCEAYDDHREWEDGIRRESIIMQWTGLKDKNGREIYEGDVVRHPDGFDFSIRFYLDRFEASRQRGDQTWDWRPLHECSNIVWVIGNIYEQTARSAPKPPAEGPTPEAP